MVGILEEPLTFSWAGNLPRYQTYVFFLERTLYNRTNTAIYGIIRTRTRNHKPSLKVLDGRYSYGPPITGTIYTASTATVISPNHFSK